MGSAAILTAATVAGLAMTSSAADSPTFTADFEPGLVCDFGLRVEGFGPGPQVMKEFTDKNGDVVRVLTGGTGFALVFTNRSTGATFSTPANGAVNRVTPSPGELSTLVATGHNVIFLFPTDVPPGPSTTLYVGRVVINFDAANNFTVRQESGLK